jgi:hypothetical protein
VDRKPGSVFNVGGQEPETVFKVGGHWTGNSKTINRFSE